VRALSGDHGGLRGRGGGLISHLGGRGRGKGGGRAAPGAQRLEAGEVARSRGGGSYHHPVLEDGGFTPGEGGGGGGLHSLLLSPDHVRNRGEHDVTRAE